MATDQEKRSRSKKKVVPEEVIVDVSELDVTTTVASAAAAADDKPKRVRASRAKAVAAAPAPSTEEASTPVPVITKPRPSRSKKATATAATTTANAAASSSDAASSSTSTALSSSAEDATGENVILQLNIKPASEEYSNFEKAFYKYEPTVDVPDAYDQLKCNDYTSQPFDVTKNDDDVVPTYSINPSTKTAKKKSQSASASASNTVLDKAGGVEKKNQRVFDHLEEFICRDEWPVSTTHACFWCCHTFHNTPFGVPTKYVNGKFSVFGCLCSIECAAAYNFYSNETKHDVWESYNLLNLLSRKINGSDIVKLAPPRHALKMFGGYMSIEEFRAHCKSNKIINTHTYPMVAMIQQLEEVNDDEQYCNRKNMFVPVDKQKLLLLESKVKLERTKPLFTSKNTLDHSMNLKVE